MATPASIAKHPIHPMLIPFPVGLFVFSLVCDIAFRAGAPPLWSAMAFWTMIGGIVGALLAAVPGFIDFLSIRDRRAWRIGLAHMAFNLTIVVLFVVNAWLRTRSPADATTPFVLSIVAVGLLTVSGWLGWTLVYRYGMGIDAAPDIAISARNREHAA